MFSSNEIHPHVEVPADQIGKSRPRPVQTEQAITTSRDVAWDRLEEENPFSLLDSFHFELASRFGSMNGHKCMFEYLGLGCALNKAIDRAREFARRSGTEASVLLTERIANTLTRAWRAFNPSLQRSRTRDEMEAISGFFESYTEVSDKLEELAGVRRFAALAATQTVTTFHRRANLEEDGQQARRLVTTQGQPTSNSPVSAAASLGPTPNELGGSTPMDGSDREGHFRFQGREFHQFGALQWTLIVTTWNHARGVDVLVPLDVILKAVYPNKQQRKRERNSLMSLKNATNETLLREGFSVSIEPAKQGGSEGFAFRHLTGEASSHTASHR